MKHSLNLDGKWELYLGENHLCKTFSKKILNEEMLRDYQVKSIQATVPGNFELDLMDNGQLSDPFYSTNVISLQRFENLHLWYVKKFKFNEERTDNYYLVFDGIDTVADVFLNSKQVGHCDNMFISHSFKAYSLNKGLNELMVHISPTVIEARNRHFSADVINHMSYNAGSLLIRKAAHCFGWDIFPRIISGGIWRSVSLEKKNDDRIDNFYLYTSKIDNGKAYLCGYFDTTLENDYSTDYTFEITGKSKDSIFEKKITMWHTEGVFSFPVNNPYLWWPKDAGIPNLYQVDIYLKCKGIIKDHKNISFGIRTVELERRDITENEKGEFLFRINDVPIYIRGTNWVPLDAFHSRDKKRLSQALSLLNDSGCNMVRCWGGGVYEDTEFFDFCDQNGIMIWQDFMMGCATYPQNDEFCKAIQVEAESVIQKLRLHPSLIVWAGDNECDEFYLEKGRNPNLNRITRVVLPKAVQDFDPARPFLCSSPYISQYAFEKGKDKIPEIHLWGPRDYFKSDYYRFVDASFISETGYHGCPEIESIKAFVSPDKMWPWEDNTDWQVHASCMETKPGCLYSYRIPLMQKQIEVLFGEKPRSLKRYIVASQISQAEAMKFLTEKSRMEKWRKTGVIWWNLLDGWPQFSDAVVDYYFRKKIAYYFLKNSQQPLALMMEEPRNEKISLFAVNDFLETKSFSYELLDLIEHKTILTGEFSIQPNCSIKLSELDCTISDTHLYIMKWKYDNKIFKNHYICKRPPYSLNSYLALINDCGVLPFDLYKKFGLSCSETEIF